MPTTQPREIVNWPNQDDVQDHLGTSEAPKFLYMEPEDEARRLISLCHICAIVDRGHGLVEIMMTSGVSCTGQYDFDYLVHRIADIVGLFHVYGQSEYTPK